MKCTVVNPIPVLATLSFPLAALCWTEAAQQQGNDPLNVAIRSLNPLVLTAWRETEAPELCCNINIMEGEQAEFGHIADSLPNL